MPVVPKAAIPTTASITEARVMRGVYTAPFTGIHGWFWQKRSMNKVSLWLEGSGGMTSSMIFNAAGESDRPLQDVENGVEGSAAGHAMQSSGQASGQEAESCKVGQ